MCVFPLDSTHIFSISTIVHGMQNPEAIVKSMDLLLKILDILLRLHVVFVEEEVQVLDQQVQHLVLLLPTTLEMGKKFVKAMALIKTLV